MGRTLSLVADSIRAALANHLLPTLLLGVASVALILSALGADTSIALGVLGIGCATAFIESSGRRSGQAGRCSGSARRAASGINARSTTKAAQANLQRGPPPPRYDILSVN